MAQDKNQETQSQEGEAVRYESIKNIDKGPLADDKTGKGLKRRAPLKRSMKPIKRKGKRAIQKAKARKEIREAYFQQFSFFGDGPENWIAPCQICGVNLKWDQADACHKLDASLGGRDYPENMLVAHGLRCGAGNCNSWMEHCQESKKEARESKVNAKTGGRVQWTEKTWQNLKNYQLVSGIPWGQGWSD